MFNVPNGRENFFGATPEVLGILEGRTLRTHALAGTVGTLEDNALERLTSSEKLAREHAFVVADIVQTLEAFADTYIDPTPGVRVLRHMLHLQTDIKGM